MKEFESLTKGFMTLAQYRAFRHEGIAIRI
jgi:hypothetical protein